MTPTPVTNPCGGDADLTAGNRPDVALPQVSLGGNSGLPYCHPMILRARRLAGRAASIRLVAKAET